MENYNQACRACRLWTLFAVTKYSLVVAFYANLHTSPDHFKTESDYLVTTCDLELTLCDATELGNNPDKFYEHSVVLLKE